jgi:NAD(P)-dependent dehydrogenase (short-subunit alcohol dehydrogenase family)
VTQTFGARRFNDKVCFITGAGSGIGKAIAKRLAAEGAIVVGGDVNAERVAAVAEEITAEGGQFHGITLDVTSRDACFEAVEAAVAQFGRLDVLGNVAGVTTADHFTEVTEQNYRWLMAVCADGPFFLSQAALPHLLKTKGNIVNIASNSGLQGVAYIVPYSMTKGAIISLTRSLAMEYLKTGVRINAIAPGATMTNIADNFNRPGDIDTDLAGRTHLMGGINQPEDVAAFFAFVASDEGAGVNGAILAVDRALTTG